MIVALNSDSSVTKLKGKGRPILPLADRMKVVLSHEAVDAVCSFDEDTPLRVIKLIRPSLLVKGGDYKNKAIVGLDVVGPGGVVVVETIDGAFTSTTKIISAIKAL